MADHGGNEGAAGRAYDHVGGFWVPSRCHLQRKQRTEMERSAGDTTAAEYKTY